MSLFNKFLVKDILLAPEDQVPPVGGGKEGMIEFLNADDDPEVIDLPDDEKEDKEDKKETKSDKDELDEFVDNDEKPEDDELELIAPARKADIVKKYPNIFKDFPYLEKAYYREQQFTEVFQTPADAKEAAEKSEALDNLQTSLSKGEAKDLFNAIKEDDPNSFNKFVDNFLPTLAETDSHAYGVVIGNVIKHAVLSMVQEGKSSKNSDLEVAAQILYKYTFGNSDWKGPERLSKNETLPEDDPNKAAQEREQKLVQKEFSRNRDSLNTKVNNSLRATIDANIDSKEQLTPYVKKQAARDAFEEVTEILSKDTRLSKVLDTLWEKAFKSDFADNDLNAIRAVINARARAVLPAAIKKARLEALKGLNKTARSNDEEDEDTGEKRNSPPPTHRRQQQVSRVNSAKDIPKGMSTYDFLNSE